MLGFLGAIILGAGLAGSSFNTTAQFNQHRRNAREFGSKIFHSKDKKGYGTFATDTGRRVWYDPNTDEWKEILSNRVVCESKHPNRLPQPGSGEWIERERKSAEKMTKKSKRESIEYGMPTYYAYTYGERTKERLVSNDLAVKSGYVLNTFVDEKYGFGVYFDEKKLKPQWFDGEIIEDKEKIHQKYIKWNMSEFMIHLEPLDCYDYDEGQKKVDDMLLFCKKYNVELDYDTIKKEVEKRGFIYKI